MSITGALAAFECVGIDFIVHLPLSMGYDAIMVVVDKFTRYGIFIPTTSDYTASSTARLFLNHVVSLGWLPSKFITDRDGKFLSDFWQALMQALDVKHAPSTAYHAQMDGATERLNQTLEIMLRAYTSPMQDDWCEHLPLVQLAYNTAPNSSTGYSPIQLLHIQPHDVMQKIMHPHAVDGGNLQKESVEEWLEKARNKLEDAKEAMRLAAWLQKKYYDARHGPLPPYSVGDFVSLRLDRHPNAAIRLNKLSQQKLQPCQITRILSGGRAVQLDLPPNINIHNVVSVQQVERAPNPHDDAWKRDYPRPAAIDEEEGLWQAEIIGHRQTKGGRLRYKVHWVGYPADDDQWVRPEDVTRALIDDYERRERRRKTGVATMCVDASIGAQCLAAAGEADDGDVIRSGLDTLFSYEIRVPRPGKTMERPVVYISRNTKEFERHYESTERELACVVWAFVKLRHLLEGSDVILVTDHASIREVLRSSASTQYSIRLDKFRMLLGPFLDRIHVTYRPGKEMTNVDPLSRARWTSGD